MRGSTAIPLVLRGEIIEGDAITLHARRGDLQLTTPDPLQHADALTLSRPSQMYDLLDLRQRDVLDFLDAIGPRLDPASNPYMAEAYELSLRTCGLSAKVLKQQYESLPYLFKRDVVAAMTERGIGSRYLDGWVPQGDASVRAFGARAVHVIAGNAPGIAALSIVRNAITRSDALIKCPSNDPLTSIGIARTMVDYDRDHPLTRHLAVALWKGGDARIEQRIVDPRRVDKLVAWGGFATIQHSISTLPPGIELITFEPKHSISIIGEEAFADAQTLRRVAHRLALDIGAIDQDACFSSRIVYVVCANSATAFDLAKFLGELTFAAFGTLPDTISAARQRCDPMLKNEIDGLRLGSDDHAVLSGRPGEGAIIVSRDGRPVDFAASLSGRTANIVPVASVDDAVRSVSFYTQTIGAFPESLKKTLRDRAACHGAQRLVSLGAAASPLAGIVSAQDGMEPLRRMCRWVSDEMHPDSVGHRLDHAER